MNERITIRLMENGKRLRIDAVSAGGVILRGEKDAFPRRIQLGLLPRGAAMRERARRLRSIKGWPRNEWKLTILCEDGRLVLAGVDPDGLPEGLYTLRVAIEDVKTVKRAGQRIEIPEGATARVDVDVKRDERRVVLTRPVSEFDDRIRTVLEAPASRLDTRPAPEWLTSARPRATRQACLLNILAKARVTPLKSANVAAEVRDVFFAATDRVFATVTPTLLTLLKNRSTGPRQQVFAEGEPRGRVHRKLLDRIEADGRAQPGAYVLQSFRARGKPSLQAVVAYPEGNPDIGPHFADLDLDLGNPLEDLSGLLIHMGELANSGRTDHLKLRGALVKGKTKPFVYYRITRS